jgi:Tfp pilus assembly protein PilN
VNAKKPDEATGIGWWAIVLESLRRVAAGNPLLIIAGALAIGSLYWMQAQWQTDRQFREGIYLRQADELEAQTKVLEGIRDDARERKIRDEHYQQRTLEYHSGHEKLIEKLIEKLPGS